MFEAMARLLMICLCLVVAAASPSDFLAKRRAVGITSSDLGPIISTVGAGMCAAMGFYRYSHAVGGFLEILVSDDPNEDTMKKLDEISTEISDLHTQLSAVEATIKQTEWDVEQGFVDIYVNKIEPKYLSMTDLLQVKESGQATLESLSNTFDTQRTAINVEVFDAAAGLYGQLSVSDNIFKLQHEQYYENSATLSEWYVGLKTLLAKYVKILAKAKILLLFGAGKGSVYNAAVELQTQQIDGWIEDLSALVQAPSGSTGTKSIIGANVATIANLPLLSVTDPSPILPMTWNIPDGCVHVNDASFSCPCVRYAIPCVEDTQYFGLEYYNTEWAIHGHGGCIGPHGGLGDEFAPHTCHPTSTQFYQLYPSKVSGALVVEALHFAGSRYSVQTGSEPRLTLKKWRSLVKTDKKASAHMIFIPS